MLENLQPVRKAGEMVGTGHDWKLTRFLGNGTFGEVWQASNVKATGLPPRAYKFFTQEGAKVCAADVSTPLLAVPPLMISKPVELTVTVD